MSIIFEICHARYSNKPLDGQAADDEEELLIEGKTASEAQYD